MAIAVVIVTYNAKDIILDCLESLLASPDADLRIILVDNASRDGTPALIRDWAAGTLSYTPDKAFHPFTPVPHGPLALVEGAAVAHLAQGQIGLIVSPENDGFAAGVNAGLRAGMANPEVDFLWVLNPDAMVPPGTARRLIGTAARAGRFGIIGGRICYTDPPDVIQNDGGWVARWSGICVPRNLGRRVAEAVDYEARPPDYIAGGHMFASRAFVETAGYMPEDYFLYYEEVDWCFRRGDLPLIFDAEAVIHHHAGYTIGSATTQKEPSEVSTYFLNRARMKFMSRYHPLRLPWAWSYSALRALRAILRGQRRAGTAALRGLFGLPPSAAIYRKIGRDRLPRPR